MKKKYGKGTACAVIAALGICGFSSALWAQELQDVTGTLGFARVSEEGACVNVRSQASTEEGEIIGILRNGDSAVIESVEEDGWYRIHSGEVEGYVAAWLIATGQEAEQIAEQSRYTYAKVNAKSLNVRDGRDGDADIVGELTQGEEAEVVEAYDGGAYVRVCVDADTYGYVSADYVELATEYPVGKTLEELEGSAQDETAWDTPSSADGYSEYDAGSGDYDSDGTDYSSGSGDYDSDGIDYSSGDAGYSDNSTYDATDYGTGAASGTDGQGASQSAAGQTQQSAAASSGSASAGTAASATGSAIASYACQFVGNPYVWGGSSLTAGADCSGFTMAVFAHFGISLPHSAASQYGCGTPVSLSDLAVGDLVFFSSSGGTIDHVAIYVGSGSIVHAANASKGICYGSLSYSTPVAACRAA